MPVTYRALLELFTMRQLNKKTLLLLLLITAFSLRGQEPKHTITGFLPDYKSQRLFLKGYTALKDTLLTEAAIDAGGHFTLHYSADYSGAALLELEKGPALILLLNRENFNLQWNDARTLEHLHYQNSPENTAFAVGSAVFSQAGARLSGLGYLLPLYKDKKKFCKILEKEIALQMGVYRDFSKTLPKDSYAYYYLNIRKLLQDITIAAEHPDFAAASIEKEFLQLDFADVRLARSGLYGPLLESYFTFLGKRGNTDDNLKTFQRAIDRIMNALDTQCVLKNMVGAFLFNGFEQKGFLEPAGHLAAHMLNAKGCSTQDSMLERYEQYSVMATGQRAPDILFEHPVKGKMRLSEIDAPYKLVVFGSAECPECGKTIPELKELYTQYKHLNLEVVWISTDLSQESFTGFSKDLPFYNYCDLKGWDSPAVKSYHVFATPTLYLLDRSGTILQKPSGLIECLMFLGQK